MTLQEEVQSAIKSIKTGLYKGTAIKVELEAQLNRHTIFSESYCERFLKKNVSKEAKKNLIFGKFYDDGSVDSEFTFTVPIDKPHLVIEYINAFNLLAIAINPNDKDPMNTDGAGMHIAILNSPKGTYPDGNTISMARFNGFSRYMTHLLPALYFLASTDHRSRGLRFRTPQISANIKYSAIALRYGVLEFRCFETCYQNPERFLDFFCVIANALKYYKIRPKNEEFFGKIGKLGFKEGRGVSRFFYTEKHLDALDKGLAILKPGYKTIKELKKERNFKQTPKRIQSQERLFDTKLENSYNEYLERVKYNLDSKRSRIRREYRSNLTYYGARNRNFLAWSMGLSEDAFVERKLQENILSKDAYIQDQKQRHINSYDYAVIV